MLSGVYAVWWQPGSKETGNRLPRGKEAKQENISSRDNPVLLSKTNHGVVCRLENFFRPGVTPGASRQFLQFHQCFGWLAYFQPNLSGSDAYRIPQFKLLSRLFHNCSKYDTPKRSVLNGVIPHRPSQPNSEVGPAGLAGRSNHRIPAHSQVVSPRRFQQVDQVRRGRPTSPSPLRSCPPECEGRPPRQRQAERSSAFPGRRADGRSPARRLCGT